MGWAMVRPLTVPSYEASYQASSKMDSHCGRHSSLRPERCNFTDPFSSKWRKHTSEWDPHIKAPRRPVNTLALACVRSTAPIGSGMRDRGFPG